MVQVTAAVVKKSSRMMCTRLSVDFVRLRVSEGTKKQQGRTLGIHDPGVSEDVDF